MRADEGEFWDGINKINRRGEGRGSLDGMTELTEFFGEGWREMEFRGDQGAFPNGVWERGERG
jgi:hypothetical protein